MPRKKDISDAVDVVEKTNKLTLDWLEGLTEQDIAGLSPSEHIQIMNFTAKYKVRDIDAHAEKLGITASFGELDKIDDISKALHVIKGECYRLKMENEKWKEQAAIMLQQGWHRTQPESKYNTRVWQLNASMMQFMRDWIKIMYEYVRKRELRYVSNEDRAKLLEKYVGLDFSEILDIDKEVNKEKAKEIDNES